MCIGVFRAVEFAYRIYNWWRLHVKGEWGVPIVLLRSVVPCFNIFETCTWIFEIFKKNFSETWNEISVKLKRTINNCVFESLTNKGMYKSFLKSWNRLKMWVCELPAFLSKNAGRRVRVTGNTRTRFSPKRVIRVPVTRNYPGTRFTTRVPAQVCSQPAFTRCGNDPSLSARRLIPSDQVRKVSFVLVDCVHLSLCSRHSSNKMLDCFCITFGR